MQAKDLRAEGNILLLEAPPVPPVSPVFPLRMVYRALALRRRPMIPTTMTCDDSTFEIVSVFCLGYVSKESSEQNPGLLTDIPSVQKLKILAKEALAASWMLR